MLANKVAPITPTMMVEALHACGVDHAISVPDWVQLPLYGKLQEPDSNIRVVPCCAEDEAVAVGAGLTMGGRTPVLLLQNQGLYASVNNVRAIALDGQIPMVMILGQFGREKENFGQSTVDSRRRIVYLLPRILDALEIPWREVEGAGDLDAISWAFEQRKAGKTAAILLGRNMMWEDVA